MMDAWLERASTWLGIGHAAGGGIDNRRDSRSDMPDDSPSSLHFAYPACILHETLFYSLTMAFASHTITGRAANLQVQQLLTTP